jgi:membrane-associated phospholipid phosphatase
MPARAGDDVAAATARTAVAVSEQSNLTRDNRHPSGAATQSYQQTLASGVQSTVVASDTAVSVPPEQTHGTDARGAHLTRDIVYDNIDFKTTKGVLFPTPPGAVIPISGEPFRLRPWLRGVSEVAALLLFIVALILGEFLNPPTPVPIFERDPAHSYPKLPETVPRTFLFLICFLMPLGIALLVHVAALSAVLFMRHILRGGRPGGPWTFASLPRRAILLEHLSAFGWWLIAFAEVILFAAALTNVLKVCFAYPRPNFFATCNYAGYDSALSSGNFAAYTAATNPLQLASASRCAAGASTVQDGLRSIPSGHALLSFACLGFATLYLRSVFGVPHYSFISLPALLCGSPLIVAAWIAITRVRDRWHFPVDVVIGALLGSIVAMLVWQHNFRDYAQGSFLQAHAMRNRGLLAAPGAAQPGGSMTGTPAAGVPTKGVIAGAPGHGRRRSGSAPDERAIAGMRENGALPAYGSELGTPSRFGAPSSYLEPAAGLEAGGARYGQQPAADYHTLHPAMVGGARPLVTIVAYSRRQPVKLSMLPARLLATDYGRMPVQTKPAADAGGQYRPDTVVSVARRRAHSGGGMGTSAFGGPKSTRAAAAADSGVVMVPVSNSRPEGLAPAIDEAESKYLPQASSRQQLLAGGSAATAVATAGRPGASVGGPASDLPGGSLPAAAASSPLQPSFGGYSYVAPADPNAAATVAVASGESVPPPMATSSNALGAGSPSLAPPISIHRPSTSELQRRDALTQLLEQANPPPIPITVAGPAEVASEAVASSGPSAQRMLTASAPTAGLSQPSGGPGPAAPSLLRVRMQSVEGAMETEV